MRIAPSPRFPPGLRFIAEATTPPKGSTRVCGRTPQTSDASEMPEDLSDNVPPANSSSPLLLLILGGFLSAELLSKCGRLRNCAQHELKVSQLSYNHDARARKALSSVEAIVSKSKRLALYRTHGESLVDLLPDISDILLNDPSWIRPPTYASVLPELAPPATGYDKSTFVPAAYEADVPRYRAIRYSLSALRQSQTPWGTVCGAAFPLTTCISSTSSTSSRS